MRPMMDENKRHSRAPHDSRREGEAKLHNTHTHTHTNSWRRCNTPTPTPTNSDIASRQGKRSKRHTFSDPESTTISFERLHVTRHKTRLATASCYHRHSQGPEISSLLGDTDERELKLSLCNFLIWSQLAT